MGRKRGETKIKRLEEKITQLEEKIKQLEEKEKKNDEIFKILIKLVFLKRLPSKSDIGRCRCVCKVWRSLLSTPEFEREHLQNNQVTIDDYKLLVYDDSKRFDLLAFRTLSLNETLPTPFDYNSDRRPVIRFKASLDGLVCFAVSLGSTYLVLANPLTGATKKLPRLPLNYLAIDDPVGFYVDPASNDYKLVCVPMFGLYGAFVFSHRLYSWESIEFTVPSPLQLIHWSAPTSYRQCLYFEVTRGMFSRIIRFDANTETFKEFSFRHLAYATGVAARSSFLSLVVLKGRLHMYVSYNTGDVNFGVDVWRMKDDDEWECMDSYTVGQHQLKELLICSTKTTDNWLAVLDNDDNSFKNMSMEDFTNHYRCFLSKFMTCDRLIYVETLVSP